MIDEYYKYILTDILTGVMNNVTMCFYCNFRYRSIYMLDGSAYFTNNSNPLLQSNVIGL